MSNKNRKQRLGKIASSFVGRQLYFVITPIRRMRSRLLYGVYRFVPRRLRSVLPALTQEARGYVREQLHRRGQSQEQDLADAEKLDHAALKQERLQFLPPVRVNYPNYCCLEVNPLGCTYAQQADHSHCRQCGFPRVLPANAEIVGTQGRYRILGYVNTRGRGRIYQGVKISNEQSVTIREYLLPHRHFNQAEKHTTHNAFRHQGTIDLVDGRQQDFRLPLKADAISPPPADPASQQVKRTIDRERCYLVTPGEIDRLPTLREYLVEKGNLSEMQVHQVLNQILQTLEALHNQKFRLPTGRIATGIPHGNLSLESVLIAEDAQPFFAQSQVTIYVTDLALWSSLFEPPPATPLIKSPAQDLVALGYIGFYLLMGQVIDHHGFTLRPHSDRHWVKIDPQLKQFLLRLLEINTPFPNALIARKALLGFTPQAQVTTPSQAESVVVKTQKTAKSYWKWLGLIGLLLLLLSGSWWWHRGRQLTLASTPQPSICCIADITGIPQGEFNFTAEKIGIWNYVWRQKNLILKDLNLKTKLETKTPEFKLNYLPQATQFEAIAQVQQGQADFAIVNAVEDLAPNLSSEVFAYDGLILNPIDKGYVKLAVFEPMIISEIFNFFRHLTEDTTTLG